MVLDTGGLEAKAATAAKGECKTWPELEFAIEVALTGLDEDVLEPGLVSGLDTGLAVPSFSWSVASTTNGFILKKSFKIRENEKWPFLGILLEKLGSIIIGEKIKKS